MEEEYAVSGMNYWIDAKDVTNVVSSTRGIILIIHNYVTFEEFIDFINRLPLADRSTVVYVSLNKTYDYLKLYLKDIKPKMFIVDGVSAGLFSQTGDYGDASLIRPPLTLNNLFEVIEKYYREKRPDYIFVDALSQLLNFSQAADKDSFSLFSSKLHNMLGTGLTKLIFVYSADSFTQLALPKMHVERMIRMEAYRSVD